MRIRKFVAEKSSVTLDGDDEEDVPRGAIYTLCGLHSVSFFFFFSRTVYIYGIP